MFSEKIFREYDIRGVVGEDFQPELATELGRAYAHVINELEQSGVVQVPRIDGRLMVGVGYDCRQSSPSLRQALIDGLLDGGLDVLDCGAGPTPQLYYAVFNCGLSAGIQVTASHNPGQYNGFKMMVGKLTLSGDRIQRLRELVSSPKVEKTERGELHFRDVRQEYIAELVSRSLPRMNQGRKLKIVVDGGNGVGGLVGPEVLRQLGCEVIELYTEPDGTFPNHHPDPTELENLVDLQRKVLQEKADCGIAWDGDADRIGVVDEKGRAIFGDMLLVIFGRQLLKEVEAPIIIGDVKCSDLMFRDLTERGAETVMSRTGHSLIKARLKELNAHLAGEMSGHMFFVHRYFGFDDALHASARLVEILSESAQPLSQLLDDLPPMVSTPELRVDCDDELKFLVAEKAQSSFGEYETSTIDGVRIRFERGWGLVRASNTQPALVLRFEAETEGDLRDYQKLVEERIERIKSSFV